MRFALGIEALGFPLDAKRGELVPLTVDGHASEFQHRLSAGDRPVPAGAFQAVLDPVAAGAFDDAGGDGVAGGRAHLLVGGGSVKEHDKG